MDTDKIKDFFLYHFEKMILVGVVAVSGFLIYQGIKKPNFLDEHQPDTLASDATQVKSEIDLDHNEAILTERQETIDTFDIVAETEKLYTAVDPSYYKLDRTWEGKAPESVIRRQDPVLVAPEAIELTPVATAIAKRARSTSKEPQYLLASLEPADELEKVEKKPRRRPRRGRGGEAGMDEMMMMGGGMDMMMDMEMGMEMGGMEGYGADMDDGEEGSTSGRAFNSDYDFGYRPTKTDDERLPEPAVGWFIVGTAVVPHKELYENFELAMADATGYDPARDTPYYYGFQVQRADVTDKPVDQLAEEDWVKVWDRLDYTKVAGRYWSGFAPEIVPEDYRDDALTMWLPPVLLDDYRSWAKHSMIPDLSQKQLKQLANAEADEQVFEEFSLDDDDGSVTLAAPGERSTGGMASMMMGGMDEMMDMEMDMEMGMDGMMMGMMMGMGGRGIETDPVDYKMIRFYDFAGLTKNSPLPGRKYVYRLRYSVVDPNFPFAQKQQPKMKDLAPDVATRVQGLMQQAAQAQSRRDLFQRWSPWSEPSEITMLPSLEHYYVGPVDRGSINTVTVAGKQVEYARNEPKAKLLASQYDPKLGARIPVELDVTEGTVLSKKMESADVVDPISLKVKKLEDAELVSGTTIVDIDGAEPLKITSDIKSPGVMLLFDQTGQLKVTDEVEDLEMYRVYTYAEERGIE